MTVTKNFFQDGSLREVVGLEEDDMPTGVPAGSHYLELDTQLEYIFDGTAWHQWRNFTT